MFLPECIDNYVGEDHPVRVVDIFIDDLDLRAMGFAAAAATGRPGYSPATMLKLYLYGYLNQVQSSRRLEREAGRNVKLMWLTGKLAPEKQSPISGVTMARRSAPSAANSCFCAARSDSSLAARLRSMAAVSRR